MSVNGSLEKTRGGGVCLRVPMHVPPPRVCGGGGGGRGEWKEGRSRHLLQQV